jgi:hypothetical protein
MPFPWLQVVQLVPSILDVSRELLRKTRNTPRLIEHGPVDANEALVARIAALEANEQRQAELVNQMAEQLATLAGAVTLLHKRMLWLTLIACVAIATAVVVAVLK